MSECGTKAVTAEDYLVVALQKIIEEAEDHGESLFLAHQIRRIAQSALDRYWLNGSYVKP